MAELDSGVTLYDINKQIMGSFHKLDEETFKYELRGIAIWMHYVNNKYFMLLCHDLRDYTLFSFQTKGKSIYNKMSLEVKEIIESRGEIISIDYDQDNNAYEIWIDVDGQAYLYYLFAYDLGVIEL